MKKSLLALICAAVLAACSSEPAPPPPLQLDYGQLGKIYLNTQDLRVIDRAGSTPQKPPYVGHLFRPTLSDAVSRWAQDRLQAVGTAGHATLIIKEASVTDRPLPTESGIESWFTREQASKYTGRLDVDLDAQTPVGAGATGMASAHAIFAITLPEKPTEVEKSAAYRQLLDGLMQDFNQKMDQAIRQHMAHFLTTGMAPAAPQQPAAQPMEQAPTQPLRVLPRGGQY